MTEQKQYDCTSVKDLRWDVFIRGIEAYLASLLAQKTKKVSTPSADTYIKIKAKRIPKGPIVDGVVTCISTNNKATEIKALIAITFPNITLFHYIIKQESLSRKHIAQIATSAALVTIWRVHLDNFLLEATDRSRINLGHNHAFFPQYTQQSHR